MRGKRSEWTFVGAQWEGTWEGLKLAGLLLVVVSRGSVVVSEHLFAAVGTVLAGDQQGLQDLLHR